MIEHNLKMIDKIYLFVLHSSTTSPISAAETAEKFSISRVSACNYLNELYRQGKIIKSTGKPVLYSASRRKDKASEDNVFIKTYGRDPIYFKSIEMAMASVHYPNNGLAMLINGETGVGKTFFAQLTYKYAVQAGVIEKDSPFISLNCADYSNNPQLITSILFGHIKGAFTGAVTEQEGLVESAENGYLFLDEAHRLPAEAQEMLFSIIDTGTYRRLGESSNSCKAHVRIIFATTENLEDTFLGTFLRRIPVIISLPSFKDFSFQQRMNTMEKILKEEISSMKRKVFIHNKVIEVLLKYPCKGNIGQLKNDIKVILARAYMRSILSDEPDMYVEIEDIPYTIKKNLLSILKNDYNNDKSRDYIEITGSNISNVKESNNLYNFINEEYNLQSNNETLHAEKLKKILKDIIREHFNRFYENADTDSDSNGIRGINFNKILQTISKAISLIEKAEKLDITDELISKLALLFLNILEEKNWGEESKEKVKSEMANNDLKALSGEVYTLIKEEFKPLKVSNNIIYEIYEILSWDELKKSSGISILLLSAEESSAKNIAQKINESFGDYSVHYYEYHKEVSEEQNIILIEQYIHMFAVEKGMLLISDNTISESLKSKLEKKLLNIPLKFLNDFNTPIIIEAVRLVKQIDMTLDKLYSQLNTLENKHKALLMPDYNQNTGTKVLLTVCLTGYGVAEKISEMIQHQFVFHKHVKIVALDFETYQQMNMHIEEFSCNNDIICVVGSHNPLAIDVPFISIDDLVFRDGYLILRDLLNIYGIYPLNGTEEDMSIGGMSRFLYFIIENFVKYLNCRELSCHVGEVISIIEEKFSIVLNRSQYVMLMIHICCMVEKMLFITPVYTGKEVDLPEEEKLLLQEAFKPISEIYKINVSDFELNRILEIINDFLQE